MATTKKRTTIKTEGERFSQQNDGVTVPEWLAEGPDGGLNVSQAAAAFAALASANSASLMTEQLGKARFILFSPSVGYVKGSAYNLWGALWHRLTGGGPPAQQSYRQMALGSVVNPPLPIKATTKAQKKAYSDYIEGGCARVHPLPPMPSSSTSDRSGSRSISYQCPKPMGTATLMELALSDTQLLGTTMLGDRKGQGGYVYMLFDKPLVDPSTLDGGRYDGGTGGPSYIKLPYPGLAPVRVAPRPIYTTFDARRALPVDSLPGTRFYSTGGKFGRKDDLYTGQMVEVISKELFDLLAKHCPNKTKIADVESWLLGKGFDKTKQPGKFPFEKYHKDAQVFTCPLGVGPYALMQDKVERRANEPSSTANFIYPQADLDRVCECTKLRAQATPKFDKAADATSKANVKACGYATDDDFKTSTVFRSIAWGVHDVVLPLAHALFVLACALLLRKRVLQLLQVQPASSSTPTVGVGGWVGLAVGYVGAALCLRVFDVEGSWWYDPDLGVLALVLVSGVCYPLATDTALLSGAMLTMAFRALVPPDGNPHSMPLGAAAVLAMWAWAVFGAAGGR